MAWFVYILRCKDDSLYTGITQDVERRVLEHNTRVRLASKYVWSRRPAKLVYVVDVSTKNEALKYEAKLKHLNKKEKMLLIAQKNLP